MGGIEIQSWARFAGLTLLCVLSSTGVGYAERKLTGPEPWRSPEWRAALRYRPAVLGGSQSEVVSDQFFSSEGGARDPQGEWEASVTLLLQALSREGGEPKERRLFRALCARPDRFLVIARSMGEEAQLDATLEEQCPEYTRWAGLASQGLAWTHSGPSFTRPESSLGHASLWLKSRQGIEHALTFGAHLNGPFDRLWALLGVATGDWTMSPYRSFERAYRELEERDVTRLTLSEAQGGGGSAQARRMLGLHLMSLRGVSLQYSFVGNNCATQTARLLDVASSLAGEHDRHPRPERWGLAPLEAAEERAPFADRVTRLPSLSEELTALSRRLSVEEKQTSAQLTQVVDRYIECDKRGLELPPVTLPLAWRASLLTLEVAYASALVTPPREDKSGAKGRVWEARRALLMGLSEASSLAHLSGAERPVPKAPDTQLKPPDRLRVQLMSPTSATEWRQPHHHLRWGLSLWSTQLSEPEASAHERLFLLGPSLWGQGLQMPRGGQLISLWSLSALTAPVARWSWTVTAGGGAHELGAPFELAWLKGGLGGALHSTALQLRAWAHLGARVALTPRALDERLSGAVTPLLSVGSRGSMSATLGWSLEGRVGLPEATPALDWLNPEPLLIQLSARVRLTSWLRALIQARALPLDRADPLQAWLGVEL